MEVVTEKPPKKAVPEGFKRTEVGVIPEDWEIKSLEELSEMITVGIANSATHAYRTKGVVLLRNQNIKNGWLDDTELKYITKEFASRYTAKTLKAGDLITARTGYPGSTCVISKDYSGAQSFTTLITRPKNDLSWTPYLNHYINSERGQQFFEVNKIGGGQKNVNVSTLRNMPVPLPPSYEEQQAIANVLDDTITLIAELDALIEKKQQIKKGAMQQLLTGKRRLHGFSNDQGFKKTDLGLLPIDWSVEPLPSHIWFQEGPGLRKWQFTDKGMKVINVTNLQENGILNLDNTDRHISWKEFKGNYQHFEVDAGDFVMASSGNSYCKTSIVREKDLPLMMNTSVIRFKPQNGLDYNYMTTYLNSIYFKKQIDYLITGGAQPNFGPYHLERVKLPIPSSESEQEAIGKVLKDMEIEIKTLQAKRSKYVQIKQGMMQELLTGKTRLV